MKRKLNALNVLYFLIIPVCVILAGAPVLIGIEIETQYQLLIEQFEQSGIRRVDHSYNRNWFSSEAETEMAYTIPIGDRNNKDQSEILFLLKSNISHGPLTITGHVGLAEINTRLMPAGINRYHRGNPATLQTFIELNGAGKTVIDLPTVELSTEGGRVEISLGSLTGEIQYAAARRSLEVNVDINELTLGHKPDKSLALGQLSLDAENWLSTTGLSLGKGRLSLTELEVFQNSGGRTLKLDQMDFNIESSETADHAALKAIYTVGSADIEGAVYGPGRIMLVVDNLPLRSLVRMQEAIRALNRQRLQQDQQRMSMMNILMAHAPGMLTDDPYLAIEALQLETPKGMITGELRLQTRGMNWIDIIKGTWVTKLLGDATLRMPEPIFKQVLQQLAEQRFSQQYERFLSQGLLKRENGDTTVVASLSDGMLNLNGRSIPVSKDDLHD